MVQKIRVCGKFFLTRQNSRKGFSCKGDVSEGFGVFEVDVVFRRVLLNEFVLQQQSFNLVVDYNPVDVPNSGN